MYAHLVAGVVWVLAQLHVEVDEEGMVRDGANHLRLLVQQADHASVRVIKHVANDLGV